MMHSGYCGRDLAGVREFRGEGAVAAYNFCNVEMHLGSWIVLVL